tara:strand:- start:354 stop:503 length:150 start_codon:yes stop_codon:yes gene_type:complete
MTLEFYLSPENLVEATKAHAAEEGAFQKRVKETTEKRLKNNLALFGDTL